MRNDLRHWAEALAAAPAILHASEAVIVAAAAEAIRASVNRQIGADVPRRRVAGGSVGVRAFPLPAGEGGARVEVAATGPLHLESNPTRPHTIAPKGQHPLAFTVGGRTVFTNRVQHPGTRGKRTWQQGVDNGLPHVDAAIEVQGAALLRSLLP